MDGELLTVLNAQIKGGYAAVTKGIVPMGPVPNIMPFEGVA